MTYLPLRRTGSGLFSRTSLHTNDPFARSTPEKGTSYSALQMTDFRPPPAKVMRAKGVGSLFGRPGCHMENSLAEKTPDPFPPRLSLRPQSAPSSSTSRLHRVRERLANRVPRMGDAVRLAHLTEEILSHLMLYGSLPEAA